MPIIEHPDVRRMLLTSKAYTEAMRALLLTTSHFLDMARTTEGEEHERYESYVEVLTPICKAWGSEWGVQVARLCLQVYGGYGYTKEFPAEQYMRDAEIAMHLRRHQRHSGAGLRRPQARPGTAAGRSRAAGHGREDLQRAKGDPELMEPAWMLAAALKQMESISKEMTKRPDGIQVICSTRYRCSTWWAPSSGPISCWIRPCSRRQKLAGDLKENGVGTDDKKAYKAFLQDNAEAAFHHNKVQTAIHFAYRALPTVAAKAAAIRSGEKAAMYAIM